MGYLMKKVPRILVFFFSFPSTVQPINAGGMSLISQQCFSTIYTQTNPGNLSVFCCE